MKKLSIYVVERGEGDAWRVVQSPYPAAVLPLGLEKHRIYTEAGAVELYMPWTLAKDLTLVQWAEREVQRLHPLPIDLNGLDGLTEVEKLKRAVALALEYIVDAEDGNLHNERSRYIARAIRTLTQEPPHPADKKPRRKQSRR